MVPGPVGSPGAISGPIGSSGTGSVGGCGVGGLPGPGSVGGGSPGVGRSGPPGSGMPGFAIGYLRIAGILKEHGRASIRFPDWPFFQMEGRCGAGSRKIFSDRSPRL